MSYFCMRRHPRISKNRPAVTTAGIPIARNIQFSKTNLIKAIGSRGFLFFIVSIMKSASCTSLHNYVVFKWKPIYDFGIQAYTLFNFA
jgi:hypothetical protein